LDLYPDLDKIRIRIHIQNPDVFIGFISGSIDKMRIWLHIQIQTPMRIWIPGIVFWYNRLCTIKNETFDKEKNNFLCCNFFCNTITVTRDTFMHLKCFCYATINVLDNQRCIYETLITINASFNCLN
jgi:hypothetical protein